MLAQLGAPGGIRTPDPLLRRQPLCPLSYRRSILMLPAQSAFSICRGRLPLPDFRRPFATTARSGGRYC